VQRQDVPIFLGGIGTVHAFNIVTVNARVDGHLDQVAFVEGQDVTEGDVLAQIDPRPFRAQLAQARAARARDEAMLANARLDLERTSALATREYATRQTLDTQRALVLQLEAAIQGDEPIPYALAPLRNARDSHAPPLSYGSMWGNGPDICALPGSVVSGELL
jgi:multidrug efflux pump subunit AcrA (membrane-fusion protein)